MLLTFGCYPSQCLDYPLLLGLNELMDFMLGDFCRGDNFHFTGGYNDSRLCGSQTAPNMVRKW